MISHSRYKHYKFSTDKLVHERVIYLPPDTEEKLDSRYLKGNRCDVVKFDPYCGCRSGGNRGCSPTTLPIDEMNCTTINRPAWCTPAHLVLRNQQGAMMEVTYSSFRSKAGTRPIDGI